MTDRVWADGPDGGTPITAAKMNAIEADLDDRPTHEQADAAYLARTDLGVPFGVAQLGAGGKLDVSLEAQTWAGWRNAWANRQAEAVRWLALGDSITEGTGITAYPDSWVYKAAAAIRETDPFVPGNMVTGQRGWTPVAQTSSSMVSPWVLAGAASASSNFGFRMTKSTSINTNATITATVTGTSVDVWWTQGTSTVAFTVWVDGVNKGSFGGASGAVTSGFHTGPIAMGASGSHVVQIKAGATASSSFINGVTVMDGNETSGLVTINAAVHGTKTGEWLTNTNHANWRQDYAALKPHLVTLLIGANDYSSTIGRATFVSNLTTIINNLRDQQTLWPTIVLVSCYRENFNFAPAWEQYEYGMERIAADLGVAYLDLRAYMPDVGSGSDPGNIYADAIHPNAAGNTLIASIVSDYLLDHA